MLSSIVLKSVLAGGDLRADLVPGMNLLSGTGKSILLSASWYSLAGDWGKRVGGRIVPPTTLADGSEIHSVYAGKETVIKHVRSESRWATVTPVRDAVVIYIHSEGASISDPVMGRVVHLSTAQLIGEQREHRSENCEGLLRDWVTWMQEDGEALHRLRNRVLDAYDVQLTGYARINNGSAISYPELNGVPVTHAGSAMLRTAIIAYALVWTWTQHLAACSFTGVSPLQKLVVMLDDVELHVAPQDHPSLLPALMRSVCALKGKQPLNAQVIVTTKAQGVKLTRSSYGKSNL